MDNDFDDVGDVDSCDIWQQIQGLTITASSDVLQCNSCNVEMNVGHGFISCPQCGQTADYDIGNQAAIVERTVVVSSDGALRSYEKTEYDKKKCIIALYETYLKRNPNLVFPPAIIVSATDILLEIQEVSTSNRGRNLIEIMAGCLYAATLKHHYSITETTIARIFNTRSGLSRGKNAVIGLLVKRYAMKGGTPHAYLKKNSKTLCSQFIRQSMTNVGLNANNRNLYMFIKCLCFIEECYGYIDTQIFNAKVVGSIVFYFINHVAVEGEQVPTSISITQKLAISHETMRKIYMKLILANNGETIRRIADAFHLTLKNKLIPL
jgi:hypothetical protein